MLTTQIKCGKMFTESETETKMLYNDREERENIIEKINNYVAKLTSFSEMENMDRIEIAKLLKKLIIAIENEQRDADNA